MSVIVMRARRGEKRTEEGKNVNQKHNIKNSRLKQQQNVSLAIPNTS